MTHDTRRHDIAAIGITCAALGEDLGEMAAQMDRAGLPEAWGDRLREVENRVQEAKPREVG